MESYKPLESLGNIETLKLFSEKVGVGNVNWEERGGGQQIVSAAYKEESEAKRIANVMNRALKKEEGDGDTIRTVQSSSGGYRVVIDHPSIHVLMFKDALEKKK